MVEIKNQFYRGRSNVNCCACAQFFKFFFREHCDLGLTMVHSKVATSFWSLYKSWKCQSHLADHVSNNFSHIWLEFPVNPDWWRATFRWWWSEMIKQPSIPSVVLCTMMHFGQNCSKFRMFRFWVDIEISINYHVKLRFEFWMKFEIFERNIFWTKK